MFRSFSKLLPFGLLVMLFAIFSCSREEDFVRQHHHKNGMSFEKKTFQELMSTKMFGNAYNRVANSKMQFRNAQRTELEEQFDFTIVEYMPVKIVTDTTGWITYNILVKKGEEKELEFHNLVMKTKDNEVLAALLKYELTEKAQSEHSSNFSKVTVTPLPIENAEKEYPCGTITVSLCYQTDPEKPDLEIPHLIYEKCTTYQTYVFDIICNVDVVWIGGDPGNGNPGSSPGNGGGGTGENPDNDYDPQDPDIHGNPPPDITAPVIEPEEIEPDNCQKVNNLSKDNVFRQKLSDLKTAAAPYSFEKAYTVYDDPTPDQNVGSVDNYDYVTFNGSINSPHVIYSYTTDIKGIIHSHYEGLVSIFSVGDLADLYNILSNASVTADFFYGMVNSNGQAYIVQIKDRNAFLQFGNKYLSTDNKMADFSQNVFINKYRVKENNADATNEANFVEMLSKMNVGLNIYKSTNNQTFENWKKLEYVNGAVVPTTCN